MYTPPIVGTMKLHSLLRPLSKVAQETCSESCSRVSVTLLTETVNTHPNCRLTNISRLKAKHVASKPSHKDRSNLLS